MAQFQQDIWFDPCCVAGYCSICKRDIFNRYLENILLNSGVTWSKCECVILFNGPFTFGPVLNIFPTSNHSSFLKGTQKHEELQRSELGLNQ